jgi:hypothetical protein
VGRLPLAVLLLAVAEDHIVQIAHDPVVHHNTITLLSSFVYEDSICRSRLFCKLISACISQFCSNIFG